jgi:hypothetical protein
MNADHAYFIGKGHSVCQDYAISGVVENGAYAIVSDGCSSSPNTDFGARALALSGKRTLGIGGTNMKADLFGKITIDNVRDIPATLTLSSKSLDATLSIVWALKKEFGVHMFGDGVFFHKTPTVLRVIKVEFESNAPAYLSYHLDEARKEEYTETIEGAKRVTDSSIYLANPNDIIEVVEDSDPFEPFSIKGLVEPGDIVGVLSDGVNTFTNNNDDMDWFDLVRQITEFKSLQGVFVERRLGYLKRQWTKEGITHFDDLSMSAIVI